MGTAGYADNCLWQTGSSKSMRYVGPLWTPLLMNPQDRRQNDNQASKVGEAFSLSPAEGERAGVRGKQPSATQRSGELPMESITLSEGKQRSTRAKAPNPWQLQAPFPLTLPLPQGEGTPQPALRRVGALRIGESAAYGSPSPRG